MSASENTQAALDAAGIADLFDARVDGRVVNDRQLAGKPAPDSYLEGARLLGVDPGNAVVVEDALAGVEAGRAGHFGLVIGVDHHDHADQLRAHGADVVATVPRRTAYRHPGEGLTPLTSHRDPPAGTRPRTRPHRQQDDPADTSTRLTSNGGT